MKDSSGNPLPPIVFCYGEPTLAQWDYALGINIFLALVGQLLAGGITVRYDAAQKTAFFFKNDKEHSISHP